MFSSANYITNTLGEKSGPPRFQSTNIRTTNPRPRSPSSTPTCPVPRRNSPSSAEKSLSERYTNRLYNRQPSPMGRYQPPGACGKEATSSSSTDQRLRSVVAEQARGRSPLSPPRRLVEESRSDVIKKRPTLEMECKEPTVRHHPYLRSRPRTADSTRRDSETRTIENRVLHTVKEVLSRAVIEKGKIDGNNIGTVLSFMTSRLKYDDTDNDQKFNIDIELKKSTTKVNIDNSSEDIPNRKVRPIVGIVRKEIKHSSNKELKKGYTKVYSSDNDSESHKGSRTVSRDSSKTIVYIDLPDPDCSKFNSLLKNEEEKKKTERTSQINVSLSKNDGQDKKLESSPSQKDPQKEITVGDCQVNDCQTSHLAKTADEIKLQNYIETLIRSMQDQLTGKSNKKIEDLCEETFCKSFCACKVCVSNRSSKKSLVECSTSTDDLRESKHSETKLNNTDTKTSNFNATQTLNKLRQSKTSNKESRTDSTCKVLKRNKNFQPESKINIPSRHSYLRTVSKRPSSSHGSCSTAPGVCEETGDDMYLLRRLPKSPIRKNTSKI